MKALFIILFLFLPCAYCIFKLYEPIFRAYRNDYWSRLPKKEQERLLRKAKDLY